MLRNYFTIALRNIARHKLYSFINIAGLAVGLTSVILVMLFVRDELSYDKWIAGSENVYRVEITYHLPGRPDLPTAQTSMPVPIAMRDQIPEVRTATRLARERMTMITGDRRFLEQVGVVDPNFLQVIRLPLVSGNPGTVLTQPESVVISQSVARKFFGNADPIGKVISTAKGCTPYAGLPCDNSLIALKVTGVMRDLPHNTQLDADMLVPNTSLADYLNQDFKKSWLSNALTFGYVILAPGTDPARVVAKLKPILDRSIDTSSMLGMKIMGSKIVEPHLTPFRRAHLTTDRYGGMKPAGSWTMLYGMVLIGLLILLVACFNFTNLATARATLRAREISLRKCVGATRRQLIGQFLGESILIAILALVLAFAMAEMLLPAYDAFLQVPLSIDYLNDWPLLLGMSAVAVFAGLAGGIYPAIVLSGFKPAAVLRANSSGNAGLGALRSILVVLQFAVAIGLGTAAIVVFEQIEFAQHLDLGFRRNNIVITGTVGRLSPAAMESFAHALEAGPGILGVARSDDIAFSGDNYTLSTQKPGDPEVLSPTHIAVSPNYFQLYGIKILAGRALSEKRADDVFSWGQGDAVTRKNEGHNVMVNAALAHALGYSPQNIVGRTLIFGRAHMKVVGVAADTLAGGVRSPVVQTVYVYSPAVLQIYSIRIQPQLTDQAMAYIGRVSRAFLASISPTSTFLDDNYERLYRSDEKQGQIFAIFVGVAIFIACLGLFGLAAFTAGRRTKEIGIRKVFGARVLDVVVLLLWQFSIPVLIANVIAWPLVWYYLHGWLQGFAYRISLNPLYFMGAGASALLIAWATVLAHARRVAGANPIHALRYE